MLELFRFAVGLLADVVRPRAQLVAENALLRQQLIVAQRKIVGRVRWAPWQRLAMALASRVVPRWRAALLLVQPATILRWHHAGFRAFWTRRSRPSGRPPNASAAFIREMSIQNPRWGAERIRGELLKLGIRVSKRTVQKYMRRPRGRGDGQRGTARFATLPTTRSRARLRGRTLRRHCAFVCRSARARAGSSRRGRARCRSRSTGGLARRPEDGRRT